MKERKSIIYSLIKVAHSFKNSLNTVFLPIFGLLGACFTVTTQVGLPYSPMHNFPRCNQRE